MGSVLVYEVLEVNRSMLKSVWKPVVRDGIKMELDCENDRG